MGEGIGFRVAKSNWVLLQRKPCDGIVGRVTWGKMVTASDTPTELQDGHIVGKVAAVLEITSKCQDTSPNSLQENGVSGTITIVVLMEQPLGSSG